MKLGDRVVATFPDGSESDVGEIVEVQIIQNSKEAFKVRYRGFDNWVPADWLRPVIQEVKFSVQI